MIDINSVDQLLELNYNKIESSLFYLTYQRATEKYNVLVISFDKLTNDEINDLATRSIYLND
jgi:membrane-anchored protein YejM (alkaline phosphatase superfamily)